MGRGEPRLYEEAVRMSKHLKRKASAEAKAGTAKMRLLNSPAIAP
jgi:hypothetical protein